MAPASVQQVQDDQGYVIIASDIPYVVGDVMPRAHIFAGEFVDSPMMVVGFSTHEEWAAQHEKFGGRAADRDYELYSQYVKVVAE